MPIKEKRREYFSSMSDKTNIDNFYENLKLNNDDEQTVLEAVKKQYFNLQFASDRLKSDYDFIRKAMALKVETLEYASEEVKDNREFIWSMIEKYDNPHIIRFASKRLQDDEEMADIYFSKLEGDYSYHTEIKNFSERIRSMEKYVDIMLDSNIMHYEFLPEKYRRFKELAVMYIEAGGAFSYVPEAIHEDEAVAMAVLERHGENINLLSDKYKKDMLSCLIAANNTFPHRVYWWVPGGWDGEYTESVFKGISDEVKYNEAFMRYIIEAFSRMNLSKGIDLSVTAVEPKKIYEILDSMELPIINDDEAYTGETFDLTQAIEEVRNSKSH